MKHNFYAGPSIIDKEVINRAIQEIDPNGDQLSLLEVSHRSKRFGDIMEETVSLAKDLLGLAKEFEVIFVQGGGRQQFFQIPFNLSRVFHPSYYLISGKWAQDAYLEAGHFGAAEVLASSADDQFRHLPTISQEPEKASYIYLCSNNTIYGTQFHQMPETNAPLVADMSSDLFSRNLDFNQFGLFYAATQKNAGTAGACLVAVRKSILQKEEGSLPTMIDYRTHIKKESLYNTPPVFAILMSLLTLRWIKEKGGISYFDKYNKEKAGLLYDEIDRNELFTPYAKREDRSNMNAVFNALNDEVEKEFSEFALKNDVIGINGHRSIGGFRASMYNALPKESVQVLVDIMKEFERVKG